MPIPSRATLKSYFETGDKPTQAQFIALIDAIYDLAQEAGDAADAAAAAVTALAPSVAKCFGGVTTSTVPASSTVNREEGCTVAFAVLDSTNQYVNVTFTTAAANTNYIVLFRGNATLTSKTVNGFTFSMPDSQVANFAAFA